MSNAKSVKELRELSGAGMMDCKRALEEADGNLEKAMEALRKSGIAKAQKKAGRSATDGLIFPYIHPGSKLGVLLMWLIPLIVITFMFLPSYYL